MSEYSILAQQFGPLANVVAIAGVIMAAGGAVALTWMGRAKWMPSEESVPMGSQKVGGVITAVVIAILWVISSPEDESFLITLVFVLLGGVLIFLVVYGYLIASQTYDKVKIVNSRSNPPQTSSEKIIGGFKLTNKARKYMQENDEPSVQKYFEGTAFEEDEVWTKPSRALAIQLCAVAYIGLVVCGTVALAGAAILVGFNS